MLLSIYVPAAGCVTYRTANALASAINREFGREVATCRTLAGSRSIAVDLISESDGHLKGHIRGFAAGFLSARNK